MLGEVHFSIVNACTHNYLRCIKYKVHDCVHKHVISCPKKHIPRFLILEALQFLTTRRPEKTAETIAEKQMFKDFESMKQKTDSKRKK